MPAEPAPPKTSLYREAFRENWNTIFLTVGLALTAAFYGVGNWSFLLLLGTLFSEFAYLFLVPDTAWYKRRVARGNEPNAEGANGDSKPSINSRPTDEPPPPVVALRPEMQQRYERLIAIHAEIGQECRSDRQRAPIRKSLLALQKLYVERAEEEDRLLRYLQAEEKQTPAVRSTTILKRAGRAGENLARPLPLRPLRPPTPAGALSADPVERAAEILADRVAARLEDEELWLTRCASKVKSAELQSEVAARAEKVKYEQEIVQKTETRLKSIYNQLKNMEENTVFVRNNMQARSPAELLKSINAALVQASSLPGKPS